MAYSNSNAMAKGNGSGALSKQTATAVKNLLDKNQTAIMRSMPKGFNYDRMCRSILFSINSNYSLAKCTATSLFISTVKGFLMGLEPNGPMGEGYLVPYRNNKKNVFEAQFIPGYRGLQNLARRSGKITECYAKAVHAKDYFEVEEGTERKIVHKPIYTSFRGEPLCFYAVFKTIDANIDFEVMSIDEINDICKRSKASEDGPWVTDFLEMAKKTVMRRLLKRAPRSIELARAVEVDNQAAMGDFDNQNSDIIDLSEFDLEEAETPSQIQGQINADRTAELRSQIAGKTAKQANSDFGMMIQQELTKSGNPLSKEQVLAYVDKEGIVLTMDMDFHDLCENAAKSSDSLI